MHHAGEVAGLLDQVVVLGRGPGDAGGVGFLEGVVADQVRRHLPGQADHRDGIHQRVHQPGHGIGRTGAGGDQHAAHLAGGPGIALGRMHRGLLVAHQDVADGVLLEQRVVDRQYRAAGVAEDDLHAVVLERAQDDLGARHRQGGFGAGGLHGGGHRVSLSCMGSAAGACAGRRGRSLRPAVAARQRTRSTNVKTSVPILSDNCVIPAMRAWIVCIRFGTAREWWRNQVACRLVY